jgi:hypothetical protein
MQLLSSDKCAEVSMAEPGGRNESKGLQGQACIAHNYSNRTTTMVQRQYKCDLASPHGHKFFFADENAEGNPAGVYRYIVATSRRPGNAETRRFGRI